MKYKTILIILLLIIAMWGCYLYVCIDNAKLANVLIETKVNGIFGPSYTIGSGVVISPDGLIVTAKHVIEDAVIIRVTLADGTIVEIEDYWIDEDSDLAILAVDCMDAYFVSIDESTNLHRLDFVYGIGNAKGLFDANLSLGWIYKNPFKRMAFDYNDMLFINMNIYPGCSGGGLYRYDKLVGIMTNKIDGYAFAVSSNEIIKFLKELEIAL